MSANGQFPNFLLGSEYALQVCTCVELVKLVCGPGRTGFKHVQTFFITDCTSFQAVTLTNLACSQVFDIDLSSDMLFFWEKSLVIRQGPLLNFAQ